MHHKRSEELAFYAEYFKHAECYGDLNEIFRIGAPDAKRHGIPAVDALHIAAAHLAKCVAFVTTEKQTKPLFRTNLVRVISLPTPNRSAQTIRQLTSG